MSALLKMPVRFKLLTEGCEPFQKHASDAAFDLKCASGADVGPGETVKIPSGIAIEIPEDHFGDIRARSSATLKGLAVSGVVDSSYRGQVFLLATNRTDGWIHIKALDRIAQLIVLPRPRVGFLRVDELGDGARGNDGFGSSGGTVGR